MYTIGWDGNHSLHQIGPVPCGGDAFGGGGGETESRGRMAV